MSAKFTHLHLHTDYSMLDGACKISKLAEKAKEFNMHSVACTDHGNMCGAIEFYETMLKNDIKPIIGCEFYVAPVSLLKKDPNDRYRKGFHLILLARDFDGYQSLCHLNSVAYMKGFYYNPRIDKELLAEHSKGLIGLSACLGGEIPRAITDNKHDLAIKSMLEYVKILGEDNFYLELQDHGISEQLLVNKTLIEFSKEYGVPLVATNDSHYLNREDASAQEVLLCIGTQKTLNDEKRMRFQGDDFYFKSSDEMIEIFKDVPSAISNTSEIADRCNLVLKIGKTMDNHYPIYKVKDKTALEYLKELCVEALKERYNVDYNTAKLSEEDKVYVDRLDYELTIIDKMGFVSYFLVVWDFINFARESGIPVGPGRGSGAGSIVAYLTHITDIDPIHYQLLFERFLNPDRVSPPDFDIDLCERRRGEVIEYVRQKYGEDSVAQIVTFGTLKTKAVLKDVARVMGRTFKESNSVTGLVQTDPKMTLKRALSESKELNAKKESEEWVQTLFDYSFTLEGLVRNKSIHAAGVIIGDQPLSNLVPLCRGANNETITQFPAGPCESLGLLKMDFLGLRTLTVIQDTLDMIKESQGIDIKSSDIPIEDKKTFELLNRGDTIAVFQLESGGMRSLCRQFGIDKMEDIIALIALYRPGPMEFIPTYVNCKMGKEQPEYETAEMKKILSETYGIMVYQEQIMQVVQALAGFSLAQSDIMRRAIGKKKEAVLIEQGEKFTEGCKEMGHSQEIAERIWKKILKFASYGFNKSHSAAYAFLAYRTAYLKANYPTEFMAAVLTSELGDPEKLSSKIAECKEMGVKVLPPNVNSSKRTFTVAEDAVLFGLSGIKGVGTAAADTIIDARKGGKFKSLLDFSERTISKINKRVMENLCKTGALDSFGLKRSQAFEMIEPILATAQSNAVDKARGQMSLFDFAAEEKGEDDLSFNVSVPDIPEWEERLLLFYEKELLGFYVTGHPLGEYANIIEKYDIDSSADILEKENEVPVRIGGIIVNTMQKISKKGKLWAVFSLEDMHGIVECLIFPNVYEKFASFVENEKVVFVEALIQKNENDEKPTLNILKILPIEKVPEEYTNEIHVRLSEASTKEEDLKQFFQICTQNQGTSDLIICVTTVDGEMAFIKPEKRLSIKVSADFIDKVKHLFGEECVYIKPNKTINYTKRKYYKKKES